MKTPNYLRSAIAENEKVVASNKKINDKISVLSRSKTRRNEGEHKPIDKKIKELQAQIKTDSSVRLEAANRAKKAGLTDSDLTNIFVVPTKTKTKTK
ncbi:hypothetical protein KAR91_53335 [Candidatus Pacearchaeota archaeon]|nr:hypothetical protein [Candidatus Pacearchaeota archaeon]